MKSISFVLALVISISPFFLGAQTSQNIIQNSIEYHGGEKYKKASYTFDFRDKSYSYDYDHGSFVYSRMFEDKEGRQVKDVLTNNGLTRTMDGKPVRLSQKQKTSFSESVNSVIYFAILPFFLNDPAVMHELEGEVSIKGKEYYKVQVTFKQEGGGQDFDDIYFYWFEKSTYSLDYIAYSYKVNGGGIRFRSAYNPRKVKGIMFQDYINYKYKKDTPVTDMDSHYQNGELTELSRIDLTNIKSN